ncbi:MAG: 3'-5' exonuclease [Ignisphaera sp.]|nr:3'-5' exonuclease [Ignisphaera sp.]
MSYALWYDVETTGLDIKDGAAIVQISGLLCNTNTGIVIDEFDYYIKPSTYGREVIVVPEAMKINGLSIDWLETNGVDAEFVVKSIMHLVTVNCGDAKVVPCGYNNSTFDKFFIEELFSLFNRQIGVYFTRKQIDVFEALKFTQFIGVLPKTFNQKLGTVCDEFGIIEEGNLHNSMTDVKLTRKLALYIKERINDCN